MAYIKKADAEKQFVQEILNAGGIESYYEMYEHGNYYYCFDLKNGTRRYWTNLSEKSAEIFPVFRVKQWLDHIEQQPSEDVMAIQTQGLAEGIRCAMCTNSMKSDTGCDGGCIVDEGMYKKVMDTIENHIVPPVTPTHETCKDCENWDKEHHFCFMLDCYTGRDTHCTNFEKRGSEE